MSAADEMRMALRLARPGFALQVDLHLPPQGITVFFGPSGAGKTTLLRCVAGLDRALGQVIVNGEVWQDSDRGLFTPTWQRRLGYVFQEASLFEHLDVKGNLQYGVRGAAASAGRQMLQAAIELLGIGHLLDRTTHSLSGGERQRVAIARAVATRPQLLLLDEPLASLDIARRSEILPWLERLRDELRIPALYVTHSADEMTRLADHLVLLEHGGVRASGHLAEAMASPAVALAIGEDAGVVALGAVAERSDGDPLALIRFAGGAVWARDPGLAVGCPVRLRILARDVSLSLSRHDDTTIQNRLPGVIDAIDADVHASHALVRVRCGNTPILSRVTQRALRSLRLATGTPVWCQVKSVAVIVSQS